MIPKKLAFLCVVAITVLVVACGPAAEDRNNMVARSKVVQDSIATMIRTALAEAEPAGTTLTAVPAPPSNTMAAVPVPAPAGK